MKLIFALTGSIKGERAARGDAKRRTREERSKREREGAVSSGPTLKLTKEFRFLYNRFNLIPALDRSGEDVSGERISISERYSPDPPGLPARPRYLPCILSYTRRLLYVLQLLVLFLLVAIVRAYNRGGSISRYPVESRRHDRDLRLFQSP